MPFSDIESHPGCHIRFVISPNDPFGFEFLRLFDVCSSSMDSFLQLPVGARDFPTSASGLTVPHCLVACNSLSVIAVWHFVTCTLGEQVIGTPSGELWGQQFFSITKTCFFFETFILSSIIYNFPEFTSNLITSSSSGLAECITAHSC